MALNDYEVSLNSTLVLGAATQVLVHGIDGLGSSAKTSDTERDGASGTSAAHRAHAPRLADMGGAAQGVRENGT